MNNIFLYHYTSLETLFAINNGIDNKEFSTPINIETAKLAPLYLRYFMIFRYILIKTKKN
jgi:hypothetical protein